MMNCSCPLGYCGRQLAFVLGLILLGSVQAETEGAKKFWPSVPGLGPATCGPLVVMFRHGPFDYRNPPPQAIIENVEQNHFNRQFAAMQRGKDKTEKSFSLPGGGWVAGGFSYTLHSFPNHHRALKAMDDYSRRKSFTERPPGAELTVECYFERAIRFRPEDVMVRFLYANYLEARKRHRDADRELALIVDDALSRPLLAYNIGLLFATRGDFDKAREFARVAYRGGFNLPGLKGILTQQGKWDPAVDESIQKPPAAIDPTVTPESQPEGQSQK